MAILCAPIICIIEELRTRVVEKYIPTYQFGNTRVSEAADDLHFGIFTPFTLWYV